MGAAASMTPEREQMIRDAWRRTTRADHDELRERGFIRIRLVPQISIFDVESLAETMDMELVVVTKRLRDVSWSAECEGIELATFRR
jgi:hypothetical protein